MTIEKILDEFKDINVVYNNCTRYDTLKRMLNELQKLKWIPCDERMPEEPFACWVTIYQENWRTDEQVPTVYPRLVGYDGTDWVDGEGLVIPYEVIAWMPKPDPYVED